MKSCQALRLRYIEGAERVLVCNQKCSDSPTVIQWMQAPAAVPGCPPGLEYMTQIDQLVVKQQIELLESESA